MKRIFALFVLVLFTLALAQSVTVDIEAVDLEASYIEYTGYVNERDHDFVAKAKPNSLTLSYTPEALDQAFSLRITARANDFDSGNWFRDQNAKRTVFQSGKFPEIVVESQSLTLAETTEGGAQVATLAGQITIKETVKDVEIPVTISVQDSKLSVGGEFIVLLSEVDIKRPSAIGEVVDDDILIAFYIELEE